MEEDKVRMERVPKDEGRQTSIPRSSNPGSDCLGVDGNRNFGFHWGGPGASADPCSHTYRGPRAESEPEVRATAKYLKRISSQLAYYQDLHAYSELVLYPYSFAERPPADARDLQAVGERVSRRAGLGRVASVERHRNLEWHA